MILTRREQIICDGYSERGFDGKVRCYQCPLRIDRTEFLCYANVDENTKKAKKLWRLKDKEK